MPRKPSQRWTKIKVLGEIFHPPPPPIFLQGYHYKGVILVNMQGYHSKKLRSNANNANEGAMNVAEGELWAQFGNGRL